MCGYSPSYVKANTVAPLFIHFIKARILHPVIVQKPSFAIPQDLSLPHMSSFQDMFRLIIRHFMPLPPAFYTSHLTSSPILRLVSVYKTYAFLLNLDL